MKLFVYGSLRMGLYNYELYLKGKSQFIGYLTKIRLREMSNLITK